MYFPRGACSMAGEVEGCNPATRPNHAKGVSLWLTRSYTFPSLKAMSL